MIQMLSIAFHRGSVEMERTKSEGLFGGDRLIHCGAGRKRIRLNPNSRRRVKKKQKESMRRTGPLGLPVKKENVGGARLLLRSGGHGYCLARVTAWTASADALAFSERDRRHPVRKGG
jgi:hypothetical protein